MKAIDYFLKLTKIPRPSGKEDKVVLFLVNYAVKNGYHYEINGSKNVIITKDNHSDKNIILQAHTDMVCEKFGGIDIDFDNDPIETIIEGDIIRANGTTLGADDGYGVSTILQILDECGEGYPNIEAIFTSDEEVGMTGAMSLDLSGLKSKMIIGLDGTSSSEITVSSAGGIRIQFDGELKTNAVNEKGYLLEVSGLLGGHSGEEINLHRLNANKAIFEFLSLLDDVTLSSFDGGNKDNAIPREAKCVFVSSDKNITEKFRNFVIEKREEYPLEKDMYMGLSESDVNTLIYKNISDDIINFANEFKDGVIIWDEVDTTFPITSINFARVITNDNKICIRSMLRSSDSEYEKEYIDHYMNLGKKYNLAPSLMNRSPYFERSKDTTLVDACVKAYNDLGYKDLEVKGIHAGLEGGVFAEKIKGAQIVCLGADLKEIHTPNERMVISSTEKLSKWIKQILKNI